MGCKLHGDFKVPPVKHLSSNQHCPKCSRLETLRKKCKFQTFDNVIEYAHIVHQNKYQYNHILFDTLTHDELITTNTKIEIVCEQHGPFIQSINKHIYQQTKCPKCFNARRKYNRLKTTNQFILEAKKIHNDLYQYNKVKYIHAHQNVELTCTHHGSFLITPANHILHYQGCPMCSASSGELVIAHWLQQHNINYKFQYIFPDCRSPLSNYQLRFDFYLPDQNILIEFDGQQHFIPTLFGGGTEEESNKNFFKQQLHDQTKNNYSKEKGIQLIRIPFSQFKNIRVILKNQFE